MHAKIYNPTTIPSGVKARRVTTTTTAAPREKKSQK
jgi:hypothetical protein